jgi:hypothetical protein
LTLTKNPSMEFNQFELNAKYNEIPVEFIKTEAGAAFEVKTSCERCEFREFCCSFGFIFEPIPSVNHDLIAAPLQHASGCQERFGRGQVRDAMPGGDVVLKSDACWGMCLEKYI